MKTLKFRPHLVEKILAGTKTSTWRLFDDKDIQVGDSIDVFNKDNGDQFGVITVTSVAVKTLGTLEAGDWEGHERYASEEEMYKEYQSYYDNPVGPATEVKIITFTFEPKRYKKIVVVDEQDRVIGTEYMRIAIQKSFIRRAARIYVFNESGELLVQQRSKNVMKPLLLDQSAAGHVDEGETYEEAAKRELFEELGISEVTLQPIAVSLRTTNFYNGIYKVVVADDTVIAFDSEELAAVHWYEIGQLETEMRSEPAKFNPEFIELWFQLRADILTT
jgi:isopentenyl-diphosphate Delta-isomerase